MKQLTQHELDIKIHGFISRKMNQFPELRDDGYDSQKVVRETRSKLNRIYPLPFIQLDMQY